MKHLIIGTAGHIDHGKTSLIKALTQIDCDTHKEEKARGITINLGFAHIDFGEDFSAGIVDVPGHKDFIETMVSGASGIDLVIFVIAADSGIMPQTREHLNIVETLGIKHGIVVLTKCDLVDDDLLELVQLECEEEFAGSFLQNAPVIPTSSNTGRGIEELKEAIKKLSGAIEEKSNHGFFRMYIDRLFSLPGHGSVVTGSVINGKLDKSAELFLYPGEQKLKVRGIQRHGKPSDFVQAGDRAAINLPGLEKNQFGKGMLLCSRKLDSTELLDVQIRFYSGEKPLPKHSSILFLSGTFRSAARIHLLDKNQLITHETALAQVELEILSHCFTGDHFILRNSSNDKTLGGGIIIDHKPLRHRKSRQELLKMLTEISQALDDKKTIAPLLANEIKKRRKPVFLSELLDYFNLSNPIDNKLVKSIQNYSINVIGKEVYFAVTKELVRKKEDSILKAIKTYHKLNPLSDEGLKFNDLLGKCNLTQEAPDPDFLSHVLNRMVHKEVLLNINDSFASPDFVIQIDDKTKEQLEWLENFIRSYENQKPVLSEIKDQAERKRIHPNTLDKLLQYLVKKGKLYYYDGDYIHASFVDRSRKLLIDHLKETGRGVNEGEFRQLINGTKKIVHPLIGIFISEKIIRQDGFIIYLFDHRKK